jgi:predicted amidophosphoribosyltransferase
MKCPSCGAAVEDGADLCLECGEPMGDSPAAKLARAENVIRPPADTFTPTPPPATRPAADKPVVGVPKPPSPTIPAKPAAKKKWAAEEPEPVRCPGCGVKSHAARCPNCGTKLKHDDE